MPQRLAAAFYALYAGLTRAYGRYKVHGREGNKVAGRAETITAPLTVAEWMAHLEGKQGLGVVPIRDDGTVLWGAIDIDQYPLALDDLRTAVERLHFPLVVLRTKSGGAHLTCFLSDAAPAALMRSRLSAMARALGYGNAEIFPKQSTLSENDTGNWLNMPYYDGDRTTRYAIGPSGAALTAADFIAVATAARITPSTLEALASDTVGADFGDGPPCLQEIARIGIAQGARNDTMFAFGVYARLKYEDAWEQQLANLNQQLCQPPLPPREVVALAKSITRKEYKYPCKRHPCVDHCNRAVCITRMFGIRRAFNDDEPDVELGELRKINHTDIPTWMITVDGTPITVTTEELMNQSRFQKACIERINKWPSMLPPGTWRRMMSERLAHVEVIAVPEDSSNEGRMVTLLEQWLATVALARSRDELLQGKPWLDENFAYFRSTDLMEYLFHHHFTLSQREVWNILRGQGAVSRQFNIKGRCVRTWGVPQIARQDEPHTLPDLPREF